MAAHHDNLYSHPKIPPKVWTDYFVAVNLHPHHRLYFSDWIKKFDPHVKTVVTEYFQIHEGSYYDAMPSVCKKRTVIKQRKLMYIIDRFAMETPYGKSPWKKKNISSLICFVPLKKPPS